MASPPIIQYTTYSYCSLRFSSLFSQAYSKANHKARRLTGTGMSSAFSAEAHSGAMAAAHSAGLYSPHCLQGMPPTSSAGYGLFPGHYPYGFIPPYLLSAAAASSLRPPIGSLLGAQVRKERLRRKIQANARLYNIISLCFTGPPVPKTARVHSTPQKV
eukprot:461038-Pyramimonas_sp.AAC.1